MIKRFLNWRTLLVLTAIGIIGGTVWYSSYLATKIEPRKEPGRGMDCRSQT